MSQGWDQPSDDAETALPWSGISDDLADQPTPPVESLLPEPLAATPADADPRPLLAQADEPVREPAATPAQERPRVSTPVASASAPAVSTPAVSTPPVSSPSEEVSLEISSVHPADHSPAPQTLREADPADPSPALQAPAVEAAYPAPFIHPQPASARCPLLPADLPPPAPPASTGGGWTIPLLCAGIALIAACVIIPLCDNNRRLAYERERLNQELTYVMRQVDVNQDFLHEVSRDPTLAQRLAQRQMKVVREGTAVLQLQGEQGGNNVSPFLLVHVAPPPRLAPYRPLGGELAQLCLNPKSQLYLLGAGLLLTAAGLVLGGTAPDAAPLDAEGEG